MAGIDLVDGKFVVREGATFNSAARAVVMGREPFYDPANLAEFQEEIIMGFLLDYARQPAAYRSLTTGVPWKESWRTLRTSSQEEVRWRAIRSLMQMTSLVLPKRFPEA